MAKQITNVLFPSGYLDYSPIRLQHRSKPHFGRKFYHLAMGLLCFILYAFFLTQFQAIVLLSTIGGFLVLMDIVRLQFPAFNKLALRLYGGLMRKEERYTVSANSYYVMGLLFVVVFFPKNIVLLSVLYLAVGDPVASMIGSYFGTTKVIGRKSLEGAFANFFASSAVTFLVSYLMFEAPFETALVWAWCGGGISVVSELFPAPIDDNFSIPVISSILWSFAFLIV